MKAMQWNRLLSCMKRAENGEELTIGFFGGSITQGSLASSDTLTYAYRVYKWWCDNFKDADIHYVNGGIGGTTSHFGVSRAEEDMLMYRPDVVIVDFSVNDDADEFYKETYEGLLRKLLSFDTKPAVLILNNVYYDTGENAQKYHNAVADYYGIPYVSILDTVYQRMKAGEFARDEITSDGLHPNDKGHELVAEEIIKYLEQIKQNLNDKNCDADVLEDDIWQKGLDKPLTVNAYQAAKRLTIRNFKPILQGFRADTNEKKGHLDFFKNGWIGKREGDRIIFDVDCSCIAVQYRKTINKPSPVAKVIIDGKCEDAVILDGNFEETWGDCLYLETVLHHGEKERHHVDIEIIKADQSDKEPFYLLSLIVA